MTVLFHKKFQKFVGRIKNKELYGMIKNEVDLVVKNSARGKILDHPFRKYKIRVISFNHGKNSYRIAYTSVKQEGELLFLLIDSRENFYKKLERIVK